MHHPTDPSDSPQDNEADTIATPEGDAEFPPDEPLAPLDTAVERPRGNEPHPTQPERKALD